MQRLDAIGAPELRAALLFVRGSPSPVTADDAAAALGVHRTVARARLERLHRAGLLETSFARLSGRSGPGAGRPAKHYSSAPELEALEFPPRHLASAVARLLDELPSEGREDALRHAGEEFGRELAREAALRPCARVDEGLEAVCAAVRSLGFHAAVERVDGDAALISTPTCPLRPLVAERLEVAFMDRGMWAGLVERGVSGVRAETVECETHSCLDGSEACTVRIKLRRDSGAQLRTAAPSSSP
jgi:predicted ArsR family transcriptional regulator